MIRTIGGDAPFSTNHKRFPIPGVMSTCPHCGQEVAAGYLSYPDANTPFNLDFFHEAPNGGGAAHEWSERVILRITIEPAPSQEPARPGREARAK